MIEITLTSFIDFLIKNGPPRITHVRNCKKQILQGYHPSRDFYLKIREPIIEFHKNGLSIDYLENTVRNISDKNKKQNYPIVLNGYKKFLKNNHFDWFETTKATWIYNELKVKVNPELGLIDNGKKYLTKLYFKKDVLTEFKVKTIASLMYNCIGKKSLNMALIDTRNGRFIPLDRVNPDIDLLLQTEADVFIKLYLGLS